MTIVTVVNVVSKYAYRSVGLGRTVAIWVGSGRVGSVKSDPCPTLIQCCLAPESSRPNRAGSVIYLLEYCTASIEVLEKNVIVQVEFQRTSYNENIISRDDI